MPDLTAQEDASVDAILDLKRFPILFVDDEPDMLETFRAMV